MILAAVQPGMTKLAQHWMLLNGNPDLMVIFASFSQKARLRQRYRGVGYL